MDLRDPTPARLVGDYILGPRIGSGSFAVVWRARHRQSGLEVAVKEIDDKLLSPKVRDNLLKEISILSTINHPNIISLFESIKINNRIYLVLEYCGGGDLAAYIHRHGKVSEDVARHFMKQLAAGLQVLQKKHLIHRDLKPQNLLLSSNEVTPLLKIGDFGFVRSLTPQNLAETLCGSPLYMAPEIIQNQKYDAKADLWSVGAILFQLMIGKPPFDGINQLQLFQNILACKELQFPEGALQVLHTDCVDLCRRLLCPNPVERLTFEEFFNHKFLQEQRQRMDVEQASLLMINHSNPFTSDSKPLLRSRNSMDTSSGHPRASISSVHDNVVPHTVSDGASSSTKIIPGFLPNTGCDRLRKSGDSQYSSNRLGVVDSLELIEKDYVLVDPHFASVENLSYYLETSLQASHPTRISNYPSKKNDIGTKEVGACSLNVAETLQVHSSGSLITSSESTMFMEVQGLNFLQPSSRLYFLYQCVQALEELAQEKYKAGQLLESFSVELVVLAVWKKAYEMSGSWMSSTEEGKSPGSCAAKESAVNLEGPGLSPRSKGNVDFNIPLSVYMWAERGFIVACDRAEQLSDHFRNTDATAEMPDAMEIIYQKALALGKAGCVDELMDNKSSAAALYSKAMFLLSFIMREAATLPLNPPLLLTPDSKKQIKNFITVLQSRQMHFLMSPTCAKQSPKPLTK